MSSLILSSIRKSSARHWERFTLGRVHGKTTDEWNTDDIRVHTSGIRVTYDSLYEWHTGDIQVHASDIRMTYEYIIRVHTENIRVRTSDIRITYEYKWVAYEWCTSDIQVHTIDIRNIKLYKGFGVFRS